MRLITWNVNSIKTRLQRLLALLQRHKPDVLCLQELKTQRETFPFQAIADAGYSAHVYGQKTYNGVAILTPVSAQEQVAGLTHGMGPNDADPQARLIEATVAGVRVINGYFPNGSEVGSEKFGYKLQWMDNLLAHLAARHDPKTPTVLCGDFNVALDDLDVAFPEMWDNSVLTHPDARARVEALRSWGFVDVFREKHPEGKVYSWWDYRMLAFPKNNGLRIDHIFATAALAQKCSAARVDREERKGEQPSDHAPVIADFDVVG